MKLFQTIMLLCASLAAAAQPATLPPGSAAPAIALRNVDGAVVSFESYPDAKGFIVAFTCNTCPYAKAYETRLIALHKRYAPLGFPVLAINPNDPQLSPGDAFAKMKSRAAALKYPFPYLYDEDQRVTAQYGPRSTPMIFIVEKAGTGHFIRYTGAIDNDTPDTNADKIRYAENALTALLQGKVVATPVTKAIGCGVRWKAR